MRKILPMLLVSMAVGLNVAYNPVCAADSDADTVSKNNLQVAADMPEIPAKPDIQKIKQDVKQDVQKVKQDVKQDAQKVKQDVKQNVQKIKQDIKPDVKQDSKPDVQVK